MPEPRSALKESGEASRLPNTVTVADIAHSLDRVGRWVEQRDYRGYEPFDGLSSWIRALTAGCELPQRIVQQVVRQSPLNLRPLLGVTPKDSTKGRGYMAWGYLLRYRTSGNEADLQRAERCLAWLDRHKVARFRDHSWSNHYDFVGRGGLYTPNDPIIVWTSLIGQAYVEAFELTGGEWYKDIAESACRWVLQLPREKTAHGDCLSYLADRQISVHNSNMLGASLLARVAKHNKSDEYRQVARAAMEYSCSRQRADGSWWYGEEPKYQWIDNFHTGYNLDSLYHYVEATGEEEFRPCLERGLKFFKAHFIDDRGRPRYYHTRTFPIDIQCAAQTIDTLALLAEGDPDCLELAKRVARWTIAKMQHRGGHFYYRRYPLMTSRTPMLHWGQATMFKALAHLALRVAAGDRAGSRHAG